MKGCDNGFQSRIWLFVVPKYSVSKNPPPLAPKIPFNLKLSSSVTDILARTSGLHSTAMAPLPSRASSLLRACPRRSLQCLNSAFATSQQRRTKADVVERSSGQYDQTPRFESPFKNKDDSPTTKIPSFANYMSKKGETSNKTFQYFMVGGMGLLAAAGAKATVQGRMEVMESHRVISGVGYGMERQWLTLKTERRFPSQHVRFSGRARTG